MKAKSVPGLAVAVLICLPVAASAQVSGTVTHLTVEPAQVTAGEAATMTILGNGTCGDIAVAFGDGNSTVVGGSGFPRTVSHSYQSAGTKTVIVRPSDIRCRGSAIVAVTVTGSSRAGVPPRQPTGSAGTPARGVPTNRPPTGVPTTSSGATAGGSTRAVPASTPDPAPASAAGRITRLVVDPLQVTPGQSVAITIQGQGPCGEIRLAFGDGDSTMVEGTGFPRTLSHTYDAPGTKTLAARSTPSLCMGSPTAVVAVAAPMPPANTPRVGRPAVAAPQPEISTDLTLLVGRQDVEHLVHWDTDLTLGTPQDIAPTGLSFRWSRPVGPLAIASNDVRTPAVAARAGRAQWQLSSSATPPAGVLFVESGAQPSGLMGAILPKYGNLTVIGPGATGDFKLPRAQVPATPVFWVRVVLSAPGSLHASPWVKVSMMGAQAPVVIDDDDDARIASPYDIVEPEIAGPLVPLDPDQLIPLWIKLTSIYVNEESTDPGFEDEIYAVIASVDLRSPVGQPAVEVAISQVYDFDMEEGYSGRHAEPNITIWGPKPIIEGGDVMVMVTLFESDGGQPGEIARLGISTALGEKLAELKEDDGISYEMYGDIHELREAWCKSMGDWLPADDDPLLTENQRDCGLFLFPGANRLEHARSGGEVSLGSSDLHFFGAATDNVWAGYSGGQDQRAGDDAEYSISISMGR